MIDSRQPNPAHVRDLLLFAVTAAGDASWEPMAAPSDLVAHLDVVDVLAIAATMINGNLQALCAEHRPEERPALAQHLMATASLEVPDPRAVSAVATIVGATCQSELAVGASIARCLSAFTPDELEDAAIALIAVSLEMLAEMADVPVRDVIAWAAGDGDTPRAARPARTMFCTRDGAAELHLHPNGR